MCGRYRIKDTDRITDFLRMTHNIPDWLIDQRKSRYNIAPSQDCPVIIMDDKGDVLPIPCAMRWGFVPFWDRSEKPKLAPINAKSEQVATAGMFRQALQKRRCLVPADGFYEWLRFDEKNKVPFDIHLKGNRPFVMAGIYEAKPETRPATFAILTTGPNELMAKIHDRMPAILDDDEARAWLQRGDITPERVAELTKPHPAEDMEATYHRHIQDRCAHQGAPRPVGSSSLESDSCTPRRVCPSSFHHPSLRRRKKRQTKAELVPKRDGGKPVRLDR